MIPRYKPYLGLEELRAAFSRGQHAVEAFEEAFARSFEARYAVAFRYGRSGLWALLRALSIKGAEVILPAYTCTTVSNAIVLSHNAPHFVDITLHDYNMDLEQVEVAISERTRAIIATHVFGYPLDIDRLREVVRAAEARWGQKIWVVHDCAHAPSPRWQGGLVNNAGDAALFSLHVSKSLSSVAGGMITTNDTEVYRKLRSFRDECVGQPGMVDQIRALWRLLKAYPRYNEQVYGCVDWLKEHVRLLERLKAGPRPGEPIAFPSDYLVQLTETEARIGLVQLRRCPEIIARQRQNARYYHEHLHDICGVQLPPLVEGATYSHFVVRVRDRKALLAEARRSGIHLGPWLDYCLPTLTAYGDYARGEEFPNAELCSSHTISLPTYAALAEDQRAEVVAFMSSIDWAGLSSL